MNKLTHRIYSKTEFLGQPMGEIRESINHRFSISLDARYWGDNRGTREGMQFMGDYEDINFFLNSGSFGDLRIEPIPTSAPQAHLSSVRIVCNNCSKVFDHTANGYRSKCPHCSATGGTTIAPPPPPPPLAVCCKYDGSIVACTCGVDYFASSNPVCPKCSKSNPFHPNKNLNSVYGERLVQLKELLYISTPEYDEQLLQICQTHLTRRAAYYAAKHMIDGPNAV